VQQKETAMPRVRTLTPGASPAHHFGSEVRRAREAAGMTGTDLGDLVPCDKATVSRIESGLTSPDEAFARACDVAFPTMNGWFLRFWQDSQTWGAAFPPALREFAAYEADAVALWTFEHVTVPGLLQTEEYARAMLERHPHVTTEQVNERVSARLARQAVLERDEPPVFWVLLDEAVLHREIGGPKVMHAQLAHLADMARRPMITVQVLPRIGAHVGLLGAFVLAETPETNVAYLDHVADGMTTDSPAIVAQVNTRFDVLRTEAHKGSESLTIIEAAVETWAT
jgi:transcriptional regulator with XRE-family HTH domain